MNFRQILDFLLDAAKAAGEEEKAGAFIAGEVKKVADADEQAAFKVLFTDIASGL